MKFALGFITAGALLGSVLMPRAAHAQIGGMICGALNNAAQTEIGDLLKEHPELNITIEGHTDSTGTAAGNQALSEKRAASVRQYLIDNFRIDGGRLKSVGYGQTKPIGPNDTSEGRQNNHRVELVKN